jgi:AcrR family transcriptional regulator
MSPRIGLDRQTLLQAATELADTEGLSAVTLVSLAQRLNIRSPSLYNHVNGLPDLLRLLTLHGLEELSSGMRREVAGKFGDDAVRALCQAYLTFARAHPGLCEAMHRVPDDADDEAITKARAEMVGQVVAVVSEYGLKGDAALHAVRVVRSLLHGFVSLERQGGFAIPLDLDVTFRLMVETFLAGVKTVRFQSTLPEE